MSKEPGWRKTFSHPHSLHRQFRRSISLPVYLNRWLVVHGNKHADQLIPEILEDAMLLYFDTVYRPAELSGRSGYGVPGRGGVDFTKHLVAGRYVSGNEPALCAEILTTAGRNALARQFHILNEPIIVCVTNGVYGYFFCVDDSTAYKPGHHRPGENAGPFLNWLTVEWPDAKLRKKDLAGS